LIAVAPRSGSVSLARTLLWITLGWNVIEGFIAVTAGVTAGSVALVGFGFDSFIEVAAASILIWRLTAAHDDPRAEHRETVAHRVVGVTFLVLAGFIVVESVYVLGAGNDPGSSTVGIALALASLAVMPALGLTKRWNARLLGSPALVAESTETLVCSYLSLTLFIGLAVNAATGWGWADVLAALAMVPWIVKEGLEGIQGESCEDTCRREMR
jgi:divalent metal cation (Fe/Co/Zn/Cd) transporter